MAQLSKGQTFTVNDTVTNTKLHTLVDNGTLASGAITEQVLQTAALTTSDVVLFSDVSAGTIAKLELAKLFAEPGPIGTTTPQPGAFTTLTASTATVGSMSLTSASIGALTGAAPSIAKAWVNFNGAFTTGGNPQTTSSLTFVGTTITANFASSHGLNIGDSIVITNGTGNSTVLNSPSNAGWTVATVPSGTSITFVINSIPAGALTNVGVNKVPIRSSYNVSSIGLVSTYSNATYIVNFSPGTFTDANYCALATCGNYQSTSTTQSVGFDATGSGLTLYTSTQCQLLIQNSSGSNQESPIINFVAFR